MVPDNELFRTSNVLRIPQLAAYSDGNEPLKKLSETSNSRSFEQADRFDGSVPVN